MRCRGLDQHLTSSMRQQLQIELTQAVFAHLESNTTATAADLTHNPVGVYTDPAWLAREQAVLFRQHPLLMGFSCQLPRPGSFITDELSGVPILVTRGGDEQVRAFLNVCRHRGARVAQGAGHVDKHFQCPYHGWAYDTCGALAGIPDRRNFAGVEVQEHGLTQLPACERNGLIWVQPATGAPLDMADYLGTLDGELGDYGFDAYHHYETRVLRQRMNWKMVIDTFLEPYHFAVLHKDTVGPIFVPNMCLFHPFGLHLRETLPRRSISELQAVPPEQWDLVKHSALVYVLFPNTVLVMQSDHVETWRVYPDQDQPDACVMLLDFYIPEPALTESARRHWDRNMDLTIRTVAEEDFPVSEGIQAGLSSGAQTHLTYGRNEPALAHFQTAVKRALGEIPGP